MPDLPFVWVFLDVSLNRSRALKMLLTFYYSFLTAFSFFLYFKRQEIYRLVSPATENLITTGLMIICPHYVELQIIRDGLEMAA